MLFKVFTKLGDIVISEKGKKPITLINEKKSGYIPYINIEAFEKKVFNKYTDGYGCRLCDKGEVLIVWDGSRSGLVGRAYKGALGSTISKVRIPLINNNYLYYFLKGKYTILNTRTKGTGTPHVDPAILWNFDFPVVSNIEQNRIVEKIEELFSDLDKATEDLKKTQEQLKIYRQSILRAAFEGKLTEEWRQTRKEASNIKHTILNNICIKAEKIKNDENSERLIKYLDIGSINNKVFKILSNKTYKIKNAPSRAKQIVKEGDTLFSTVRTYLKNISYVHSEYDNEVCSTGFCVIRPKKGVLSSKYIFYYVISDDFVNRVSPLQTGTSYPAVRDDDILKQTIPLVTIDEQEQIINEIESRLSVCDKVKETAEQNLSKIEYLRQSILKKAFEGKLVPQWPDLPAPQPGKYWVYVIKCNNDSNYIGFTSNLRHRWEQHLSGEGAEWTKKHKPQYIMYWEEFDSKADAIIREDKLKTGYGRKWIKREEKQRRLWRAGEPAEKLLERIKQEKEKFESNNKKRKKR
jgi:type I restriction enzyme S subunit